MFKGGILMYNRIVNTSDDKFEKKLRKIVNDNSLNDKWVERSNLLKIKALENYGNLDRMLKKEKHERSRIRHRNNRLI